MKHVCGLSFVMCVVLVFGAGCATLEPVPMGPSMESAHIQRAGVERTAHCRSFAHNAMQQARQGNVQREVGGAALGTLAGALLGQALSTPGRTYAGPYQYVGRDWYGHPVYRHGYYRERGTNLTVPGAIGGGIAGAAIAHGHSTSLQAVYDDAYHRCMSQYGAKKTKKRSRR